MSKSISLATMFAVAFLCFAIVNPMAAEAGEIQQESASAPQEVAPPASQEQESSPSDGPVKMDSVLQDPVPVPTTNEVVHVPSVVSSDSACGKCCCNRCECPVPVTICLVEPDCGCSYEVCVKVPPCCVGQAPQVKWRNGILGRKIAKLCWPCCDKRAKVVIPVIGGPRVFDF